MLNNELNISFTLRYIHTQCTLIQECLRFPKKKEEKLVHYNTGCISIGSSSSIIISTL